MKVGDLVELSAAGKKIQSNYLVVGLVGVVQKISDNDAILYPYKVYWFQKPKGFGLCPNYGRRELKFVKKMNKSKS